MNNFYRNGMMSVVESSTCWEKRMASCCFLLAAFKRGKLSSGKEEPEAINKNVKQ